jgi:O-antigen ligase
MKTPTPDFQKTIGYSMIALAAIPALAGTVIFGCSRVFYVLAVLLPLFLSGLLFFTRSLAEHKIKIPPASWILGLIVLYMAGLHAIAPVAFLSWANLLRLTGLLLAYLIWANHCTTWNQTRLLWGLLLVVLSGCCWYAVWRHFNGNMGFSHDQHDVLLFEPSHYRMRASGTFICPNHFAHVLVMGICVAVGLLVIRTSGWALKLLSGQYLLVAFPCLLQSGSRAGWVGLVAGLGVLFTLLIWKKSKLWCVLLMSIFSAGVAGLAYLLWKYLPFIQNRIASGSAGRLRLWPDVITMTSDQPVTGWGAWMFRHVFPAYKSLGGATIEWRFAHNEFLHVASETGLIGLGLTLLLIIWWYVRWLRFYARAESGRATVIASVVLATVTASLIHALFDFNLTMYANAHILVLIVGTATGLEGLAVSVTNPKRTKLIRPLSIPGAAGSLTLLVFTFVLFMNQLHTFNGSRKLYLAENPTAAIEDFKRAEQWYSGYWKTWHNHGMAARSLMADKSLTKVERKAYQEEALTTQTRAYEMNPFDHDGAYGLSEVFRYKRMEDFRLAFLKEAIALDPGRTFYWQRYFRTLNETKGPDSLTEGVKIALQSKAISSGQINSLLRKENIKGVDLKALEADAKTNPRSLPRRIFREDADALAPLYSWEWAKDGSVTNWSHALLEK